MRVLAVSRLYPTSPSDAAGIFIHRLHRGLVALGDQVHVLQLADWAPPWPIANLDATWRRDRAARRKLADDVHGIPIHHPLVVTPRPSRFFPRDYWEHDAAAIVRYCQRRPELASADVIIGHFMLPDGFHALRLAQALDKPVLAMAWGDDLHAWPEQKPTWRPKLQEVLAGVDVPIGCSERMVADGNRWLETPRDDWRVVYAGVDTNEFKPVGSAASHREAAFGNVPELQRSEAKVLFMLARAVRAKGYVEMLDAWRAVEPHATDWHLVMAGTPDEVDVAREIAERGLARAHWLGARNASDVPALLRASDAFVLPSHNEGLSLSVLEALATGLPTIATNVGGHAEVMRESDDGWLVPPRDTDALVAALRALTSASDDEMARRRRASRAAAVRIGSPAANARRLHDVLAEARERRSERAVLAAR